MKNQSAKQTDISAKCAGEPFGGIYARFMLDHIVELCSRLAFDVVKRPAQFAHLSSDIMKTLENFRTRLGNDPDWPDSSQRGEIFDLFLGSSFTANSASYRLTVLKFAEGASTVNQGIHENALADSASSMKSLLSPAREQAAQTGYRQLSVIFEQAVKVFQSDDIRQAFGIRQKPDPQWPLDNPTSDAESVLLDEVFRQSGQTQCQAWGRYYFSILQRVAFFGRGTISTILTEETGSSKQTKSAVDFGYRWTRALNDLLPAQTVIRAWRQPSFKTELSDQEQLHLPSNPAGEVDTTNANLKPVIGSGPQQAGPTFTVNNEVCCSTTPSVSCLSHCPPPADILSPGGGGTYPCCTHHC